MEEDVLASWRQLLKLPHLNEGIQLIVAMIDDYAASGGDAESRLTLSSALLQSVSVSLQDRGVVLVSKLRPDEVAAILVNPTTDQKSRTGKQMGFVQEYMRNAYQASVTIGISRDGREWKEIPLLFREVKYTIADARQSGSGQLAHVGSTELKAYEDFRLREFMLPGLLALAESEEPERVTEAIERAFGELDAKAHSFAYIQSFSLSLLGEMSRKLWHDSEAIIYLNKRTWHRLLESKTVGLLKDIVLEYFDSAFALAQKERTQQQHHLIHRISSYIEDHLSTSLTVKQLADMFHISAGHLSVLFKKETGQTISDFVKGLRMKKAKELLQDPTVKIYEVADRVGLQTPAYFTYQFKKHEGCTPQEYRDRYYR
jgi:two-component system response regulator YesN